MNHVAFLRTRIDFIDVCFAENEVSEIWITFPDPQPQKNRSRKRLTNPDFFLNRYKKILKPRNKIIHEYILIFSLIKFRLLYLFTRKL